MPRQTCHCCCDVAGVCDTHLPTKHAKPTTKIVGQNKQKSQNGIISKRLLTPNSSGISGTTVVRIR